MFEVRRYRVKLSGKEFVGLLHSCGAVIDLEYKGWMCHLGSTVEPIPDPVPEFAEARETLGNLQQLLLEGKIPWRLCGSRPTSQWGVVSIDGMECWGPPPPKSQLKQAIEWAELAVAADPKLVSAAQEHLMALADAARKQLAAEKGGGV